MTFLLKFLFLAVVLWLIYFLSKFFSRLSISYGYIPSRLQSKATTAFFVFLCLLTIFQYRTSVQTRRIDTLFKELRDQFSAPMDIAVRDAEGRIESIRSACGQVCKVRNVTRFVSLKKHFDCSALFGETVHDLAGSSYMSEVPRHLSDQARRAFGYDGVVNILEDFRGFDLEPAEDWTREDIDDKTKKVEEGDFSGFGNAAIAERLEMVSEMLQKHLTVAGKTVLVLGDTDIPWMEAVLIAQKAKKVVSLDRRGIQCNHSKVHILHPNSLSKYLRLPNSALFDVVVSYNSHMLGFGRMGDGLHPWADLVQFARAWCVTKKTAKAMVMIPTAEKDLVAFNAHRVYGPVMKSQLFSNWRVLEEASKQITGKSNTTVAILTKSGTK